MAHHASERYEEFDVDGAQAGPAPDEVTVPEGPGDRAERERLAALHSYGLLDRDLDAALGDLARLATLVCGLPMGSPHTSVARRARSPSAASRSRSSSP